MVSAYAYALFKEAGDFWWGVVFECDEALGEEYEGGGDVRCRG